MTRLICPPILEGSEVSVKIGFINRNVPYRILVWPDIQQFF